VKTFRLFVLVLLAMLLPLRGVSAAALLCEQQPSSHTVASVHDHELAGASSDDHSRHDHSDIDKSRHCLSSCSAPLLMEMPSIAAPVAIGTTVFPHLAALAPTFLSDGQERPPRSI
jgi:hypothetical protein